MGDGKGIRGKGSAVVAANCGHLTLRHNSCCIFIRRLFYEQRTGAN